MHLSDYLRPAEGDPIRATALAKQMGVSHTTIIRLAKGEMEPSAEMLKRLHAATGGKVTPNDMLGVEQAA